MSNKHFQTRYDAFIQARINRTDLDGYTERHHIKPSSLFPELEFIKSNIVILTAREHYLAHWMLAKIYGGVMWFAFNQMKRVAKGRRSVLYEMSRKYISDLSRKLNTGRTHSEEVKTLLSDMFKGTVVVRDCEGNLFRVLVDNEKYKSGELVFYRVGYKHTEETKRKITESRTGFRMITDGINIRYIVSDFDLMNGWRYGAPDHYSELCRTRFLGSTHFYNPNTGETYRGFSKPEGFIKGRTEGYQTGLEIMNSKIKVYDFKERKRKLIDSKPNEYQTKCPNNGICIQIGNLLFESRELFSSEFPFINTKNKIISPNIGRSSDEGRLFKLKYAYTSLSDLGIIVSRIDQWSGNPNEVILITKDNINEFRSKINEYRRTFISNEVTE